MLERRVQISEWAEYCPIVGSALSDDGRWVAVVSPRVDGTARPLWMRARDLDGEAAWSPVGPQGGRSCYCPTFSPDSAHLAGFSDHEGVTSAWSADLHAAGLPARTLLGTPPHPSALKWTGPHLACLGEDPDGWRRVWWWEDLAAPPLPFGFDDEHAGDFAISADGTWLAWLAIPGRLDRPGAGITIRVRSQVTGETQTLPLDMDPVGYLAFAPSDHRLAFQARPADEKLAAAGLWIIDLSADSPEPHSVTAGIDGWITGYDWSSDGGAIILGMVQGVEGCLVRRDLVSGALSVQREPETYLSGPHHDRSRGRAILLRQSSDSPQRLFLSRDDAEEPLTDFNRDLSVVSGAQTFRWDAPDGLALEGVAQIPSGEGPFPLIVWLHGGPAEHIAHTFSPYFQVFAAAGYAVFSPNYRGSTGRDHDFLRASVGDLGGADVDDVVSGIDAFLTAHAATVSRTHVVGWSYGGTLGLHVAARCERVKRMVVGAPVVDWVSFFGAPRFPALYREYFRAPFWVDRAPYDVASPVHTLAQMNTPTLILHGAGDALVPLSQSRLLYRALKARGVETDLMIYPGEGHVPTTPTAVEDMLRRILAFLDRDA